MAGYFDLRIQGMSAIMKKLVEKKDVACGLSWVETNFTDFRGKYADSNGSLAPIGIELY